MTRKTRAPRLPDAGVPELLDASAAAELLEIKPQTLYAYASRGLLHSVPAPTGRTRLYPRSELLRLKQRAAARSGHAAVAATALSWGQPVLDSAVTEITEDGPCYRGIPAVQLARAGVPFEAVTELLWGTVPLPAPALLPGTAGDDYPAQLRRLPITWPAVPPELPTLRLRALLPKVVPPLQLLLCAVPLWAQHDPERRPIGSPRDEAAEQARARALIRRLPTMIALLHGDGRRLRQAARAERIAVAAAVALGTGSAEEAAVIEQLLVLIADHELNTSAFAARVAASVGTDLYGCIEAALAVLTGPQHGAACDRVEDLLTEVGPPARAASFIRERARRGEAPQVLGHPLYPKGDPRTRPLLELALAIGARRSRVRTLRAMLDTYGELGLPAPSVEFGMVAAAEALGLPAGSASALFALGRSAGWLAHVFEQRRTGAMVRPRARYIGPSAGNPLR